MSTRPYTLYDLQHYATLLQHKLNYISSWIGTDARPTMKYNMATIVEDTFRRLPKRSVTLSAVQSIRDSLNDICYQLSTLYNDYMTSSPAYPTITVVMDLTQQVDSIASAHGITYPEFELPPIRLVIDDEYFSSYPFNHSPIQILCTRLRLLLDTSSSNADILHGIRHNKYNLYKDLHKEISRGLDGYKFKSTFVETALRYDITISIAQTDVQEIMIEDNLSGRLVTFLAIPLYIPRVPH